MGGLVPATLAGHTTPETAVAADGTLSIKFAQDGSDAGFIQSVPLKFSATGRLAPMYLKFEWLDVCKNGYGDHLYQS